MLTVRAVNAPWSSWDSRWIHERLVVVMAGGSETYRRGNLTRRYRLAVRRVGLDARLPTNDQMFAISRRRHSQLPYVIGATFASPRGLR